MLNATVKEQLYITLKGRYVAKSWPPQISIYSKGNVLGRRENKRGAEKYSTTEKHLLGSSLVYFFKL